VSLFIVSSGGGGGFRGGGGRPNITWIAHVSLASIIEFTLRQPANQTSVRTRNYQCERAAYVKTLTLGVVFTREARRKPSPPSAALPSAGEPGATQDWPPAAHRPFCLITQNRKVDRVTYSSGLSPGNTAVARQTPARLPGSQYSARRRAVGLSRAANHVISWRQEPRAR
jgi:hypothetical protein